LTAILLATGGPSNPFTIGYLFYIALAAIMFNARWAWAITLVSIGSYGLLFVVPLRLMFGPDGMHPGMEPDMAHQASELSQSCRDGSRIRRRTRPSV
jgi:hypothetical protein